MDSKKRYFETEENERYPDRQKDTEKILIVLGILILVLLVLRGI